MSLSYVTQSHNIKKVIKGFETNNILKHDNSMLALWKAYGL